MIVPAKVLVACLLTAAVLALSACGGSKRKTATPAPGSKVVDIYSSLPLVGASAGEAIPIANGIKLALAQADDRAGQFAVHYVPLNDASASGGGWTPVTTADDARRAVADSRTVYYIGEFDSGASEVSIPILNLAGIPQVSPASTYDGLTTSVPGTRLGEPSKYYPSARRTFLRIVPSDSVEAAADLLAIKLAGCSKLAVANDGSVYGVEIATLLQARRGDYGVDIVSNVPAPVAAQYSTYAATIKAQGADCFEFAGTVSRAAVQITKAVHAAIPGAKIFGPSGMCTSSWTNPAHGGVPAYVDPRIQCTLVTQSLSRGSYPGAKAFLVAYRKAYGISNPNPYALYGYEAMKLGLDTIAGLGANGDNRADVLGALFAITARHSVLGTYGFDANGDTTLRSYGLYKVGRGGDPVFEQTITPTRTAT